MTHMAKDHGLFDGGDFTQFGEGLELVLFVLTPQIELLGMEGGEKR